MTDDVASASALARNKADTCDQVSRNFNDNSLTDFTVLYASNNVTFLGLTVIRSAIDYLARVCSLNERV